MEQVVVVGYHSNLKRRGPALPNGKSRNLVVGGGADLILAERLGIDGELVQDTVETGRRHVADYAGIGLAHVERPQQGVEADTGLSGVQESVDVNFPSHTIPA